LLTAELGVQRTEIQLRQHREQIEDGKRVTSSNIEGAPAEKHPAKAAGRTAATAGADAGARAVRRHAAWLLADEGASVSTGQLVAKVSELNNYKVEASLSDFHARALSRGQQVLVEQGNVKLKGEVQPVRRKSERHRQAAGRWPSRTTASCATSCGWRSTSSPSKTEHPAGRQRPRLQRPWSAGHFRGARRRRPQDHAQHRRQRCKAVEIRPAPAGDQLIISDTSRYKDRDSVRVAQ
jgi:HlyD family secretion protein